MAKHAGRTGRPPKPSESQKKHWLQVRITATEQAAFKRAAELAGIGTSTWVRERLRMIARKEIKDAGEKPAF
jgi:hypothetical protein